MRVSRLILFTFLFCSISSFGQTLKQLDYSSIYKSSDIEVQKVFVEHENGPKCLEFERFFDRSGRITKEIRYFACGKVHSIQQFTYDEKGHLLQNTFAQVFMQFEEMTFNLVFNDQGQLVERSLPMNVPQGWEKEQITYHPDGSIKACIQMTKEGESWQVFTEQVFENTAKDRSSRKKNSLTKVHDVQGLPLVTYGYDQNGEIKSTMRYTYITYSAKGKADK